MSILNGDGSSWRQRRESGERTKNMTTTLQTVQYACAMCVVEYVDQQSASTATNALIEHKSFHPHYHHHFGLLRSSYSFARDCKRERERERVNRPQLVLVNLVLNDRGELQEFRVILGCHSVITRGSR